MATKEVKEFCAHNLVAIIINDMKEYFPDTDEKYKDANSLLLLRKVGARLTSVGYRVVNIDSTIIAQAPKLAPHIHKMRMNIAFALDIPVDSVSVKATTEEGLGFSGEKLGIAAHAVCLIEAVK